MRRVAVKDRRATHVWQRGGHLLARCQCLIPLGAQGRRLGARRIALGGDGEVGALEAIALGLEACRLCPEAPQLRAPGFQGFQIIPSQSPVGSRAR